MPSLIVGRKAVAAGGTAEALGASQRINSIIVTAFTNNTNPVTVGGSTVVGALATRKGTPLAAGASVRFDKGDVDDLADIYVDVVTNAEGVTYTASIP